MSKIYLVDDDPAVRDSLALLLEQDGYEVRAFENADAFLDAAQPDWQGCAIVDLRMPAKDGLALQEEMVELGLLLPVIFLSGHGDIPATVRAMRCGAVDFLTKPVTAADLVASIRAALKLSESLEAQSRKSHAARSAVDTLTEREREVMHLVAQGRSNKEIARALGISHRTVEIHRARVMRKTNARSEMELFQLLQTAKMQMRVDHPPRA